MQNATSHLIVKDFASLAKVSVQAIHKAMKSGRITRVKRMGPIYLIHRSELAKFKRQKSFRKRTA